MRYIQSHLKLLALAVSCVALGAGASAIATASAAPPTAHATAARSKRRGLRPRRLLGRAVHGNLVVAAKGGFVTITVDRGVVKSLSGRQLTLREGTKKRTYQVLTLTIPANARVRDNGHRASLTSVKPGQRAIVVQAPHRTLVIARTPHA